MYHTIQSTRSIFMDKGCLLPHIVNDVDGMRWQN